ncbi:hypothetical protein DFJ73DRAFT_860340 [Zopfochytrium polystomum]|nr:hypothetical protein DFJ73DRAFT_860340 [Zopfochytrium polystomum]
MLTILASWIVLLCGTTMRGIAPEMYGTTTKDQTMRISAVMVAGMHSVRRRRCLEPLVPSLPPKQRGFSVQDSNAVKMPGSTLEMTMSFQL